MFCLVPPLHRDPVTTMGAMSTTPDADDNGTDQSDTDPSSQGVGTQTGAAASGDEPSTDQGTGEAEGSANCDAVEADQAATDADESNGEAEGKNEGEPFPPRGVLALRALRWAGLLGAVVFAVTTLALLRGLVDARNLIPDKVSALTTCMIVAGLLAWPFLNLRDKKRPVLATTMTTVMAALGMATSAHLVLAWWNTYQETGFSVLFLLALAGVALSAALFLSIGPLLHYLRSTAVGLGDDEDPSRWGRLRRKTGEKTDKGLPRYESIRVPRRTRAYLTAMVLAPALALGSALVGAWALINPVHHGHRPRQLLADASHVAGAEGLLEQGDLLLLQTHHRRRRRRPHPPDRRQHHGAQPQGRQRPVELQP